MSASFPLAVQKEWPSYKETENNTELESDLELLKTFLNTYKMAGTAAIESICSKVFGDLYHNMGGKVQPKERSSWFVKAIYPQTEGTFFVMDTAAELSYGLYWHYNTQDKTLSKEDVSKLIETVKAYNSIHIASATLSKLKDYFNDPEYSFYDSHELDVDCTIKPMKGFRVTDISPVEESTSHYVITSTYKDSEFFKQKRTFLKETILSLINNMKQQELSQQMRLCDEQEAGEPKGTARILQHAKERGFLSKA